ncbi:MAG: NAD(P)H-binding protein [Candidatus Methylomirabilis sp.]|nr:NAD(P)H-binding protein [Deltaproteobacteria bacterium]
MAEELSAERQQRRLEKEERIKHRVLVTGANGTVGRALVKRLVDDGWQVRGLVRSEAAAKELEGSGAEVVVGAIDNAGTLRKCVTDVATVFHLVGSMEEMDEDKAEFANSISTYKLAIAANVSAAPRLIFLSVLGASPGSTNLFLRTKGRGEQAIIMNLRNHIILRSSYILAPGSALLRAADALLGKPKAMLFGAGDQQIQPIALDDVIEYLVEAMGYAEPLTKIVEIGGADRVGVRAFFEKVAALRGKSFNPRFAPASLAKPATWLARKFGMTSDLSPTILDLLAHEATADLRKTSAILGHKPKGLDAALKEALGV